MWGLKINVAYMEIFICISICKCREKCSFMQCVEKALKVFVSNKLNMSASHKFALMFLTNTALWVSFPNFKSDLFKTF